MADMPFPQEDFDEMPAPEDIEGMDVELPEMPISDVEELPDGGAIVKIEEDIKVSINTDFYENLAESMDNWELSKIAMRYLELIEKDKQAREERDKQYEEGLRRTGLGHDAPGGASFNGASKVVHPIMAEACVDFAARAIKELFPPDGPVRTKIIGDVTEEKLNTAERKRDFNNWQLTTQIKEYRDEKEQLLTQLPLGGSQYLKLWFDDQLKRPRSEFVPIDNIYLPFATANFYTAQRVTEVQDITQMEYERRVNSELYRDLDLIPPSQEPDQTKAAKANDKIEGRQNGDDNQDGVRRVYHIYTYLQLDDDGESQGDLAPYILMLDELTSDVLGLYRNWEEGDKRFAKLDWIVEFKFIPWRGAYAIGLPHLIGGLSAALTGALRALLDSAHINNAATMLKLKGAKISGQSTQIEVTQVAEIEGAPGVDDVRKIAMPMPFNPPSPILYELLGWLTGQAKGVVTSSEEKIADINANAPVGTTQALIEQGSVVYSAIHARLHDSESKVLQVLNRINRWYLADQMEDPDLPEGLSVQPEDFEKNSDVQPVSDPHIFSETQRMAQLQAVMALAEKNPDLYDRRAVQLRALKQLKVPDAAEILPDPQSADEHNPAEENVKMALGQFATAYPMQDHLAHLQSHFSFFEDPMLGSNPLMAPQFLPKFIEHTKQHLTLWYLKQTNAYVQQSLGELPDERETPDQAAMIDQLYAAASKHVVLDTKETFANGMQVVQKAMQMLQQMMQQRQQQPPTDPNAQALVQASMAETQRKAQKDQVDAQLENKKIDQDFAAKQAALLTQERIKAADLTADQAKMQQEQFRTVVDATQKARNLVQ